MWSPRRVVMLSGCFLAFFLAYLTYAFSSVGRIDGLPPLPEALWPTAVDVEIPVLPGNRSRLDAKLKLAFGEGCKERKWDIRLDIAGKNMVLAAEQFQLTTDGRVCLDGQPGSQRVGDLLACGQGGDQHVRRATSYVGIIVAQQHDQPVCVPPDHHADRFDRPVLQVSA